jgi:L-fuculose-phosphate aldolase
MQEWEARQELCRVGREIHARQYVSANDGNFSYRLSESKVLATPTMISKGQMTPEDLIVVDMEGRKLSGDRQPTSETHMHLSIFRERPDVHCVVHAHPPHATAFAVVQQPLPKCILPEVEIFIGEIPITAYATPGTPELADSLRPYIKDFTVFLLANHGVLATGRTVQEAHWRLEVTEAYCRILLLAGQLGEANQFTARHMDELFKIKERLGLSDRRLKDTALRDCALPSPSPGAPAVRAPGETSPTLGDNFADDESLVEQITAAVLKRLGE